MSRAVIEDVDAALAALLRRELGGDLRVEFGPAEVETRATKATVRLHLHDVRESVPRRRSDWEDVRDEHGLTMFRRLPARRYELSYAITVEAPDAAAEHALLGRVLGGLDLVDAVPVDLLSARLAAEGIPVLLALWPDRARPLDPPVGMASALGTTRPWLDLVVITPVAAARIQQVDAKVAERRLGVTDPRSGIRDEQGEPASTVDERRKTIAEEGSPPAPAGATPVAGGRRRGAPPAG